MSQDFSLSFMGTSVKGGGDFFMFILFGDFHYFKNRKIYLELKTLYLSYF